MCLCGAEGVLHLPRFLDVETGHRGWFYFCSFMEKLQLPGRKVLRSSYCGQLSSCLLHTLACTIALHSLNGPLLGAVALAATRVILCKTLVGRAIRCCLG